MSEIYIDPRISIKAIPDGEVHIEIRWTVDELEKFARAYLSASEEKTGKAMAVTVLRLRNKEGIGWLIAELQEAMRKFT